jgi:hypothetical protein
MGAGSSSPGVLSVSTPALSPNATGEVDSRFSIIRLCNNDMKKFEYMLFIAAESCRLSYCDVGILHQSLRAYGLSPDVLNAVITHYDNQACPTFGVGTCKKRNAVSRLTGQYTPPESYELSPCAGGFENGGKPVLVQYISSPTDTTCLVISPTALKPNQNSIIQPTDCIVSFKGSSSIRNWDKNLRASADGDFAKEIQSVIPDAPPGIKVSTSYVSSVVEIYANILEAMEKVCPGHTRIFVFGHSKGGAECELAGAMFKMSFPDKEVHIISLGAPKVVNPQSLNSFNNFFFLGNQGRFTLTRVESTAGGKADLVTKLPVSMTHPGWTDEADTIDALRRKYSFPPANNQRSFSTWPFRESMNWWDSSQKPALDQYVQKLVGQRGGDSNYVKISGYTKSPLQLAPHMEYFGIYFWGSQRLAGMGNPAKTSNTQGHGGQTDDNTNKTFVANIFQECTKYKYVPWRSRNSLMSGVKDTGTMGSDYVKTLGALGQHLTKKAQPQLQQTKSKIQELKQQVEDHPQVQEARNQLDTIRQQASQKFNELKANPRVQQAKELAAQKLQEFNANPQVQQAKELAARKFQDAQAAFGDFRSKWGFGRKKTKRKTKRRSKKTRRN